MPKNALLKPFGCVTTIVDQMKIEKTHCNVSNL